MPGACRRVLAVYDVPHWAQNRHTAGLQRYAPPGVEVTTASHCEYGGAPQGWIDAFDAVYVVSLALSTSRAVGTRLVANVASHAWLYPRLDERDWRTRGVNPHRCARIGLERLRRLDAVVCRNRLLGRWASKHNRSVAVIPAGVDTAVFCPLPPRRNRRLRVGWCGQLGGLSCFKGHDEVLAPLRARLPAYDWSVNARDFRNAYCAAKMADWYRSLDVFLTTACNEGTPNPPFEAAACGAVVVATDVGQLSDWRELRDAGLVVPAYRNAEGAEAAIEAFASKLNTLEDERLRLPLRERLIASICAEYDYRTIAPRTVNYILGGDESAENTSPHGR